MTALLVAMAAALMGLVGFAGSAGASVTPSETSVPAPGDFITVTGTAPSSLTTANAFAIAVCNVSLSTVHSDWGRSCDAASPTSGVDLLGSGGSYSGAVNASDTFVNVDFTGEGVLGDTDTGCLDTGTPDPGDSQAQCAVVVSYYHETTPGNPATANFLDAEKADITFVP